MNQAEFQKRTRAIGLRVLRMTESLPSSSASSVISRQIIRSATSIGANYRAACRAQSQRDLIRKLKIVEEEADETLYWLELLVDSGIIEHMRLANLMNETEQILAMTVASIKTLRSRGISRSQ